MSNSTSLERRRSGGRTYADEEWERVKPQFYYYYMEKNMSLKDAAKAMSDNHRFDATLRQWERRIAPEKWGFSKYASRDDRLKAIDASGKSLLDVSQRGRRKSTASDGRPSLLEDRNLRRFARREVSRESHGRARSASVVSDQSDNDMGDTSAAPSPAPSDSLMNSQDEPPFSTPEYNSFADHWIEASTQSSTMEIPQIRIYDQSYSLTVPQINISGPDESYIAPDHIPISLQAQVNVHYPTEGDSDSFSAFSHHVSDQYSNMQIHPTSFHSASHTVSLQSNVDWNESLPASGQSHSQNASAFTSDNNTSMSYTDFLQYDSQDLQSAVTGVNHQQENFNIQESRPQGSADKAVENLEFNPDFEDPTYVDVFAVLKERDARIFQMISLLKQTCQNPVNAQLPMSHVIDSIELLERGVEAQNIESERDVRRTLKNISSTKTRNAQYINDLSTKRKRKIEQLHAQIDAMNVNQRNVFPYG